MSKKKRRNPAEKNPSEETKEKCVKKVDILQIEPVNSIINSEKDVAVNFMESMMLSFILLIGYIAIITEPFNGITCIVYTAPCVVSSLARYAKINRKLRLRLFHLFAMIISFAITLGLVFVSMKGITDEIYSFAIAFYPLYEIMNSFAMKYTNAK